MAYKNPAHRNDREKKVRFTVADYAVIEWWAERYHLQPAELIRMLTLKGLEAIVSEKDKEQGRAA